MGGSAKAFPFLLPVCCRPILPSIPASRVLPWPPFIDPITPGKHELPMRRWLAQLTSPISRWLPAHATQTMTDILPQPRIIPRPEHGISRKDISPEALKVLYRLNDAGFE